MARALVLMCVGVAVFSLAHDILYQRIIWLLLGVTLATGTLVSQERAGEETPPDVLIEQLRQVLPAEGHVLPEQEGVPANGIEPRKKAS